MGDVTMFNREYDTSISGRWLYPQSDQLHFTIKEEKAPYPIRSAGTAYNTDLWQLEEMFNEFQELASRMQENQTEIPDVFDLRPLSSRRLTLRIREVKPASFYFVYDSADDE